MTLDEIVFSLVKYGEDKLSLPKEDEIYVINRLLSFFKAESFEKPEKTYSFEKTIQAAIAYGKEHNLAEIENLNEEDNFEGALVDLAMPRPSQIIEMFWEKYQKSPDTAIKWYYALSKSTDYIKTARLAKNISYKVKSSLCDLDITINLSKPEKDPKEIAKALSIKSSSYPKCLLCKENEGYYGTFTKPARADHRLIPLTLNKERFYLQYSPYGYFNEHCIVLADEHTPMKIDSETFKRLFDFIDLFPNYLIGSNADLPIVGGSILTHEHYQGGRYVFPLMKAKIRREFKAEGYPDVRVGEVSWPLSVMRLISHSRTHLEKLASRILACWRSYSDEKCGIVADDGIEHNTITPIAYKKGKDYILDLALRNNLTSSQYPDGIFHPHPELFHIKKENIGLIEVMGLAILPGRLLTELRLAEKLLLGQEVADPSLDKHRPWLKEVQAKHPEISPSNVHLILQQEVGEVFAEVLSDCGVFKQDEEGQKGFERFAETALQ
jgi:UDPglucose--hexose-1-phosphate uridylyltransferase